MGYLICYNCYGYYKLESDESPEDFSSNCECGGNLEFTDSIDLNPKSESGGRDKITYGYSYTDKKSFNYKIVMVFGILIIFVGIMIIRTLYILGFIITLVGISILYKGYCEVAAG